MDPEFWFTEKYSKTCGLTFKIKNILYTEQTKFQRIDIVETYDYGKVMLLDGFVMFTEKDEFIYHEMITQPALYIHKNPEDVLVVGGGDGGTIRELLKHNYLNSITEIEIDSGVVEASKKFFPHVASGYSNKNVNLIIGDGIKFVQSKREKYDIIIIDSTDPFGPAKAIFSAEFYKDIKKALKKEGIVVAQGENPYYDPSWMMQSIKNMRQHFNLVKSYLAFIPTYPSGMWNFTIGFKSDNMDYYKNFDLDRYNRLNISYKYYNENIHTASFALPEFVKMLLY